jgi:hypothetical protein
VALRGSGQSAVHLPGVGGGAVPAVGQNPATRGTDGIKQASELLKNLLGK